MSIFEFERDFAGSLRCIPMVARQKLDLVGVKLTLRQWSRMTREQRGWLTEQPCDDEADQAHYRAELLGMIEARCDEPAGFLPPLSHDDWAREDRMPAAVTEQATRDGIAPPDEKQWRALSPLQRFALVKLSRSRHENENFMPAMREFGLCSDPTRGS